MPEATGPERHLGRHIVLLGMMGSGKTTIGVRLAARLGRPYIDSDDLVQSSTGRDAAAIAAFDGVEALHETEASLLLDGLRRASPVVIAAAASVVENAPCREALAGHSCIWLDADAATLASRQQRARHRRELFDAENELAKLKQGRDPHFAELSTVRIDTAATSLDDALATALEAAAGPDPG